MVRIALQIKVTFENVQELKPSGPEFRWYLKFTCSSCGETSDKWNYASISDSIPAQHGSAVNHFVSKCKLCSRENSMKIIEDSIKSYNVNDQNKFKTIIALDCRGLEPTDFSAREGWVVKAIDGGKEFENVDLSEGEWVDYCDKINKPVGVYEIEHKFERIK